MNIGILKTILTSTLVNFSILQARLTSIVGTHDYTRHIHIRCFPIWTCNTDIYVCETTWLLPEHVLHQLSKHVIVLDIFMLFNSPYEHCYSLGNTDIYACGPQYYPGKTHINAADPWNLHAYLCQVSHHMHIGIPLVILTSTLVNLSITSARFTSMRWTQETSDIFLLGFPPICT